MTLAAEAKPASNGGKDSAQAGAFSSCQWAVQGFPKGPALLSYLYAELAEAESHAALVRFLFVSAFRPYMRHIRSWMYSTAEVDVAFADVQAFDDNSLAQLPDSTMVRPVVLSPSLNKLTKVVALSMLSMPRGSLGTSLSSLHSMLKQHEGFSLLFYNAFQAYTMLE